jgi:hypothetical protein
VPVICRYLGATYREIRTLDDMNAPHEMTPEELLRFKLETLRREHRDLDEAIQALEANPATDQFTLKRLKKQKLRLKDEITLLEDKVTPDIIA